MQRISIKDQKYENKSWGKLNESELRIKERKTKGEETMRAYMRSSSEASASGL